MLFFCCTIPYYTRLSWMLQCLMIYPRAWLKYLTNRRKNKQKKLKPLPDDADYNNDDGGGDAPEGETAGDKTATDSDQQQQDRLDLDCLAAGIAHEDERGEPLHPDTAAQVDVYLSAAKRHKSTPFEL
eukprot:16097-Heterococcus_DN1.PRE.1